MAAADFTLPSRPANLGPYDGWLLSEMARSLGDAKFAAFWKSRAAVPDAFRAAAGEDLDGWIRGWGQRIYGSMAVGPGLPVSSIVSGFGAIGVALWLANTMADMRRNQDCVLSGRRGCTPVEYDRNVR